MDADDIVHISEQGTLPLYSECIVNPNSSSSEQKSHCSSPSSMFVPVTTLEHPIHDINISPSGMLNMFDHSLLDVNRLDVQDIAALAEANVQCQSKAQVLQALKVRNTKGICYHLI